MSDPKLGRGDYEHSGSSLVEELRERFLNQIRLDMPHVLGALRTTDGTELSLLAWAAEWHLQDQWILEVARRTFKAWRDHPETAAPMHWAGAVVSGEWIPEPAAIRWEPTLENAEEFIARARHLYVPEVRRWANSLGLTNMPQKKKLTRDLSALVQYQVKGDDLDAVADEFFESDDREEIARRALTSIAGALGLTLRM